MSTSKKVFFTFFLVYCLILFLGLTFDWHYVWSHTGFNFTSGTYPFGDIRNVTNYNSFIELGLDPRTDEFITIDGQRIPPFNYPLFWLLFPNLNVNNNATIYFGLSFFILFAIGVFLSLKIKNKKSIVIYFLLLFSPVVALLIERGNNDQVAFFCVAVFCYFHKNKIIKLLAYYFAFAVKFFPIVIIASLTENFNSKSIKLGFIILFPILVYVLITYPEVIDLGKATPISFPDIGYGWKTYSLSLSKHFSQSLLALVSIVSIFLVFVYFIMIKPKRTGEVFREKDLIMFKSGMLIYIATYIVGTNFDYRLVFLLFTIPALLTLNSKISIMTIFIIVFLFWSHQFTIGAHSLSNMHIAFHFLGRIILIIKTTAQYALILLLIHNYRVIFEPCFLGWKLKNKIN